MHFWLIHLGFPGAARGAHRMLPGFHPAKAGRCAPLCLLPLASSRRDAPAKSSRLNSPPKATLSGGLDAPHPRRTTACASPSMAAAVTGDGRQGTKKGRSHAADEARGSAVGGAGRLSGLYGGLSRPPSPLGAACGGRAARVRKRGARRAWRVGNEEGRAAPAAGLGARLDTEVYTFPLAFNVLWPYN
jgi:hypothetical protein